MDWNPNNPDLVGAELLPRSDDTTITQYRIDSASKAVAERIDSTVSETMTGAVMPVIGDTASTRILTEILLAGQEVPSNLGTGIYRPTVLTGRKGVDGGSGASLPHYATYYKMWTRGTTTTDGDASDVNGAVLDESKYVTGNASTSDLIASALSGDGASFLAVSFDTSTTLNGKRIRDVRLHVVAGLDPAIGGTDVRMLIHLSGLGSLPYTLPSNDLWVPEQRALQVNSFPRAGATEYVTSMGEILPADVSGPNGQPIKYTNFSGALGFVLQFRGSYVQSNRGDGFIPVEWIRVFQIWMEVDYCDENRVSSYVSQAGVPVLNWPTSPVRTPTGGSSFGKVNGTDLTVVTRQPRYGDGKPTSIPADYTFSVPYLEDLRGQTPVGLSQYSDVALNEDGTVGVLGDAAPGRVVGFEFDVSGVQSVDAVGYALAYAYPLNDPTLANRVVFQHVSNAAAITYEGVILPVRVTDAATGNLTITLKQGATVLKTITLTPDQARAFDADPVSGWRMLTLPFTTAATLAPATQYTIQVQAANAREWTVPFLDMVLPNGTGNVSGLASYRGATDAATFHQGGVDLEYARRDLPFLLYSQPDTPTGFDVAAGSTSVGESGGDCSIGTMGRVDLTWTATAEARFAYYEIQRNDPRTDWQTIAKITDQAVDELHDYEGRIGLESCYRLRVVATTGLSSPWTSEQCATRAGFGTGLYLSANSWPEGSLAYKDTSDNSGGFADRVFSNPESGEVVDRTLFGRDGQVSFIPAERRFDQFKRRLMLYDKVEPTTPGTEPADPLRGLSRAGLPYVCVCDAAGGRWFCNVKVGDLTVRRPGPFLWVDVDFDENTRVAYPVDSTS